MKKKVKALIIAASVAAVAGIGAVSFAKWEAGTDNAKTVTDNQLGAISVLTFDKSVTTNAVTGLLPIDQNTDAYNATTNPLYGVMEFQIEKTSAYAYSDFTLTVEISKTGTFDAGTKFYARTTAPTAAVAADEIDADNGIELTYTITESGTYSLYIYHDSAKKDDMNQKFDITLTLSDGTTAVSGS